MFPGERTWGRSYRSTAKSRIRKRSRTQAPRGGNARRALHGTRAGHRIREIPVDTVFIGSCTNSRIEDLRLAAAVAGGTVQVDVRAMVVPGSMRVRPG